jgi:hypothetical protein
MIDMKKSRIRIHKTTLHMLGNPEYIQLLVSPTENSVAIRCANSGDKLIHRINRQIPGNRSSHELYSQFFFEILREVFPYLENNKSYRIYGKLVLDERIARFDMRDIIVMPTAGEVSNGE